jgi:hypothetical protein
VIGASGAGPHGHQSQRAAKSDVAGVGHPRKDDCPGFDRGRLYMPDEIEALARETETGN